MWSCRIFPLWRYLMTCSRLVAIVHIQVIFLWSAVCFLNEFQSCENEGINWNEFANSLNLFLEKILLHLQVIPDDVH
jgi:hypothetical protein